jgi:hypothetical protein
MDSYRIGVSIILANGVSPVLAVIGRDLLGLNTSIKAIEKNFGAWTTAMVGFGSVLAGASVLGAMFKLAEKAGELQDAMIKISQLNPKVAAVVESGEMRRRAFEMSAATGLKANDIVSVYGGLYGVLQDPEEAMAITPMAARYARLMEARHPGSHPEGSINTVMRAGELSGRLTDDKGAIDPQKVKEWFDTVARLDAATHGQVNPETLLALAQQGGGVSLRGLSQEGYEHMAIVSQMMGGHRAGTALLSLRQQMTGTMFNRNAQAMAKYGLLNEGEYYNDHGRTILTDAAKERLTGLVSKDPMQFVMEVIKQLEARGITDKDHQMMAISEILGRQTTQRFISDMLLARAQIERETKGLEQGAGVDKALGGYSAGSLSYNLQNMHTAWDSLMKAIGDSGVFIPIIQRITSALNSMTEWVSRLDPATVDTVTKAIIGFGAGLITLGTILGVALISTLVGAPALIAAVGTALVAAVGALIALNWQSVVGMFNGIASAISTFIDQIVSAYNTVKDWLHPKLSPEDKKFTDELKKQNGMFVPMSFHPGERPSAGGDITLSLNVDGVTLAQVVSDQLQKLHEFSTSAPAANGGAIYSSGDHNFSSV